MSNVIMKTKCTLCEIQGVFYREFNKKRYYNCPGCRSIFMDPEDYLTPEEEKNVIKSIIMM